MSEKFMETLFLRAKENGYTGDKKEVLSNIEKDFYNLETHNQKVKFGEMIAGKFHLLNFFKLMKYTDNVYMFQTDGLDLVVEETR